MAALERPFLFDATRLVARGWSDRLSTGLDRVCYAYLSRFGARAQAVVQHRGVMRILTPRHSERLFDLCRSDDGAFRRRLLAFAPRALASASTTVDGGGAIYINVSHTDFDLPGHTRWTERCGLRPIYLIHDLIPITHSQYCRPHAVRRHRGRVVNALATAAGIVVNSAATADQLADFAREQRLPMPATLAAPLAGYSFDKTVVKALPRHPYFLCVGTIEPRKNHLMLLDVWRRLIERSGPAAPRLVIVGQWGANSAAVRSMLAICPSLHGYVTMLDRCGDRDLGDWIAGARAVLLPSLAEGFGLPMAEALELGAPVIASDLPCFREIGQGVPMLIDPGDAAAWERAIDAFHRHDDERDRQLAAMRRFRPSTWDHHFAEVETWLRSLPPRPEPATAPVRRLPVWRHALAESSSECGFPEALIPRRKGA